jgi:hypothetical protein
MRERLWSGSCRFGIWRLSGHRCAQGKRPIAMTPWLRSSPLGATWRAVTTDRWSIKSVHIRIGTELAVVTGFDSPRLDDENLRCRIDAPITAKQQHTRTMQQRISVEL